MFDGRIHDFDSKIDSQFDSKFDWMRIIAEPSAKAAATHGAGSLIVGTLGVALVAALAVVKSRFGANAKVPTAPVLV